MKVLDLFSGIGGFSLGLEAAGMETVAFCEQDTFCQKVLAQHWRTLPIHSDITELNGYEYRGSVELVCGGFPCQPFSVAGKQRGAEDDRALWPEMLRVIREVAPRWVIGENVSGIIPMELDKVLSDLEGEGYTCWTFVLPACAVDAHHRRDRVWVVAHSDSNSKSDVPLNAETPRQLVADSKRGSGRKGIIGKYGDQSDERGEATQRRNNPEGFRVNGEAVSDAHGSQQQRGRVSIGLQPEHSNPDISGDTRGQQTAPVWLPEPNVGRVANGVPNRSHRLKALGNAVVPSLVAEIGRLVMRYDKEMKNG
jgi:DNA (cytosine-5)-methyltransferase 1